jgi:hypothetical protein
MYKVSPKWEAGLRAGPTFDFKANLFRRGELIEDGIPLLGGSITDDSTATLRKRVSLNLAPTPEIIALIGHEVPELTGLWPLGNELNVLAGQLYPDGTSEYVPMGMFRISKCVMATSEGDLTIGIEGWDRSRTVSRARFIHPYNVKQGLYYHEAIQALLMSRIAFLEEEDFLFTHTNFKTPNLIFTGPNDDPMAMAIKMAGSVGMELLFDGVGKPVLRPIPDPQNDPPSFLYEEGPDAIILTAGRDLDDEQAYNGCIVTGETTSNATPVRGEAWDDDPLSPTYYDPDKPEASIYGAVPEFITSEFVTTKEQAVQAAIANLGKKRGVMESMKMTSICNYAHDSSDVISAKRALTGLDDVYSFESLNFGFGDAATMSATARKQRVGVSA